MSRLAAASMLFVLGWSLGPPGQQIAAADDAATAKQIEKWILDLDHDRFTIRGAASANLFKTGRPAIDAHGGAEMRSRALCGTISGHDRSAFKSANPSCPAARMPRTSIPLLEALFTRL
jgi:hypothetical protein